MTWAEGRARQVLPLSDPAARVPLWAFCNTVDTQGQALFTRQGFKLLRHNLRMVIELDGPPPEPVVPAGITLRTITPGQEEYPAFIASREAFEDHFGHVVRPLEEEYQSWSHRVLNSSDYDPGLWFVALDGDQIAGVSLCFKTADTDPSFGWVASLSVRRPWRKQGLGLALLQQSIAEFHRHGYRKVGSGRGCAEPDRGGAPVREGRDAFYPRFQMTIFEKRAAPRQGYLCRRRCGRSVDWESRICSVNRECTRLKMT